MYTVLTNDINDYWEILKNDSYAIMLAVYDNNNFSHYKIITKTKTKQKL